MKEELDMVLLAVPFEQVAVLSPDKPPRSEKSMRALYELYLDFLDGTPQQGKPIRFQARALTGNIHVKIEFMMDSNIPMLGGKADSLSTIWKWSYAEGTVTFQQAGGCKIKVAFKLVFQDHTFRIIDRVLDFYVMK